MDDLALVSELTPTRPFWPAIIVVLALGMKLWISSLSALVDPHPGLGIAAPLLLVVDLLAAPMLVLFWTPALTSRSLRATPEPAKHGVRLAYLVFGKGGGAWLTLASPRLLLATPPSNARKASGPRERVRISPSSEKPGTVACVDAARRSRTVERAASCASMPCTTASAHDDVVREAATWPSQP